MRIPRLGTCLLLLAPSLVLAFQVAVPATETKSNQQPRSFLFQQQRPRPISATKLCLATEDAAKHNLKHVAKKLGNREGLILYSGDSKGELDQAAKELEAVAAGAAVDDFESTFLGDWDLVCTTSSSAGTTAVSRLADVTENLPVIGQPLQNLRRTLQDSVQVQQRIRSSLSSGVDRVDNVIMFEPRSNLADIFGSGLNLPQPISDLDINPLDVSTAKLALVHKASVDTSSSSASSTLRTKLTLESIVLSVAGTSQYLDPSGADVLGINIPSIGDFLNSGTFDTTYLSSDLRISRGKLGPLDQLRVFIKKPPLAAIVTEEEDEVTSSGSGGDDDDETDDEDSFIVNGFDEQQQDDVTPMTTSSSGEEEDVDTSEQPDEQ